MTFELTPKQWEEVYAYQAKEIESLATDVSYARRASVLAHYSRVGEWLNPNFGRRVLEVGCGPGRYVAMLASLGFDVVGVDPVAYPTWPVIEAKRQVKFMDLVFAEALPFPDASFDHVACIAALLYFQDPTRALVEIRRVLKPGGRMVLRTVSRWNLYHLIKGQDIDPATRNRYNKEEFVKLASDSGFEVDRCFSYGFYPPIFAGRWWHLVNGIISTNTQSAISNLTPSFVRHHLVIFCTAAKSGWSAKPKTLDATKSNA
jgi:SAM-dependent methyltransferase